MLWVPMFGSRRFTSLRHPANACCMKTFWLSLLAASSLHAADLIITLQNPPDSGQLRILLFDSAETFGDLRDPVFNKTIAADGQSEILISDVPTGEVALMVHHDENSNGELDKNFIGIPREPTGFANGYSPKGPPTYQRALLTIPGEPIAVDLSRPLGERGRFGAGLGVIFSSSPYRKSDDATIIPIPAITYTGNKLQVFGPRAQYLLAGSDTVRLALAANYRPPAYKEDDSPVLEGFGDRDGTLLAGPELKVELPKGFGVSLGYRHDVLDQIGGGEASVSLDKSFLFGNVRLTPKAGLRWISGDLTRHDVGTPTYRPGSSISTEIGLGAALELTGNWWLNGNMGIERLGSEAADSPIVEDDYVIKGFFAVSYLF